MDYHPSWVARAGVIFIASLLITLGYPRVIAHAATKTAVLSLNTTTTSLETASSFLVDLTVNTGGQAVSIIEASIAIPENFQYEGIDFTNSVFDKEITPAYLSGSNLVITRARFDTGYTGTQGLVATVLFTPKVQGKASLTINRFGETGVYAYEDGSNILESVQNVQFSISDQSTSTQLADIATAIRAYNGVVDEQTIALTAKIGPITLATIADMIRSLND